ncbi:p115 like vesicle tethering protein [Dendryphion nanum]|uniref:P115 like vesicle tethering protein n=1 Tax=Dendryphion nanum TaxID=256645 RepID=A0A9P9EDG1_9PLEO|nr:p115 like vesicle tethering protein [Dendryphion nanum]
MLRILESQAPAKQTATDTISTLSSRLSSATLLEDRRAAILGLRSFAKEYPASVASGSLRGLIACLTKDAEDVDTIKVVLETLSMLFNPNDRSPEASDEIALWLADEFTQRQDNITILLDLLETPDFYSRLYSLQLIQAIYNARPERTQECILTAPLGTPRLVATLDDPREAVRNAALVLLNDLSQSSSELQKLFVFENAFERIFSLIEADGALTQGGIVVQDCLSLLANLVRFNASNQTNFRETGGVAKSAALLPGSRNSKKAQLNQEEDDWISPQSDKNIWGLLAILRMFIVKGSTSTRANQSAFHKHGLLQQTLNIAFEPSTALPIKIEALNTCADIIRGNPPIQQEFAQLQVRPFLAPRSNGTSSPDVGRTVHVIEALLDLALSPAPTELFDARYAACECIKAYFYDFLQVRMHFLQRAIDGHTSGQDETANILTTLLLGFQSSQKVDPYRIWFAATLVFHLIFEDHDAKDFLMQVAEGDAESGEEVVTCIQAVTGNLIASLQPDQDERYSIAYLMLLCGWLFEDAAAVNDFLGEASSLQSLVQFASRTGNDQIVVKGLCASLLGIIYEFSTKDSPISRRDLQPILTQQLGREKYLDAISQLRQHPFVRDFEVLPRDGSLSGSSPEVFFDATFIDFLKDNFSRLSRAIDRDPGLEQHHSHEGIDRDLVDSLRGQIDERSQAIERLQNDLLTLEQRLNQEQADHRRTQESSLTQLNTIKRINDDLHTNHDADIKKLEHGQKQYVLDLENKYKLQIATLQKNHDANVKKLETERNQFVSDLQKNHDLKVASLATQIKQISKDSVLALENTTREYEAKLAKTIRENDAKLDEGNKVRAELERRVKAAIQSQEEALETVENLKKEIHTLKSKIQDQTWKVKDAEDKLKKAELSVKEKEGARAAAQTELDDLFVVLGDLEEKRTKDKKRLKELGEEVSDGDDDDEEEDEDDDDDDEDDDDDDDEDKK